MASQWLRRAFTLIAVITLVTTAGLADAQARRTPRRADDLASLQTLVSQLLSEAKYTEALAIAERYAALSREKYGEDREEYGAAISWLASVYEAQGRYVEAEPLLRRALAIAEKVYGTDYPIVATVLDKLAGVLVNQSHYTEAEPLYKRALAIEEKALGPNHRYVGASLSGLAQLYIQQGRYAEAEPLLRRSLAIFEKALGPEHPDFAAGLSSLAGLYQSQGRYAEVEPLLKRSLSIVEAAGTDYPIVAAALQNLAGFYSDQDRYTDAEPLLRRALNILEKALGPENPDTATALGNLAELYRHQGRYAEAEPLYNHSLAIREKVFGPEDLDVAIVLSNLSELYCDQGRYAEAEPLSERALAIREKALGPEHPRVATILANLALLSLAQHNWVNAAEYWQRATKVIERRAERGLAGSEGGSAKGEAVRNSWYFSGLIKMTDRLAPEGHADRAQLGPEMFEKAQWAQASEAAGSLTQMAARSAKGDTALAGLVRERQDLVAEWQAKDKQLIAAKSQLSAKRNPDAEKVLSDRIAAIDGRLRAIDAQFAKDFPEYASLTSPKADSVAEVKSLLGPDETLVLFLDTPEFKPTVAEETFIWVVTKTNMRWAKTTLGTKALTERIAALRCGLDPATWDDENGHARCRALVGADPGKSGLLPFDLAKAHELYEALFGSIKDEIAGKRLLIVPSGPLAMLPFGILVTEDPSQNLPKTADGYSGISWLGIENAITVLPSVSSLSALRKLAKGSRAPELFIGFGDPALQGIAGCGTPVLPRACPGAPGSVAQAIASIGLPSVHRAVTRAPMQSFFNGNLARVDVLRAQCPLPETAFELKCVAQSLGVPESQIQLRQMATETAVKNAPLDHYQIVYFATHGLLASETKRATGSLAEPALLLSPPPIPTEADDGLLTASEITQLKLNADWVILSACNTAGAGDTTSGEALSGLARAFFYAGARALLVSHWAMDSEAAVLLTTRTFAELKKNPAIARAEALRRAMQAVIDDRSRPDAAHPSFWAPFVVVGEGAAR
jgi:CHAT domain-containing protein/tetratricopeptide (TPR) repeat protein